MDIARGPSPGDAKGHCGHVSHGTLRGGSQEGPRGEEVSESNF